MKIKENIKIFSRILIIMVLILVMYIGIVVATSMRDLF